MLVMMFLSVPVIFGSLRTVTMGARLVIAIVIGFSFYLLNQFFGPFSLLYQLPPVLAASLPSLLFASLAVYLLRQVR